MYLLQRDEGFETETTERLVATVIEQLNKKKFTHDIHTKSRVSHTSNLLNKFLKRSVAL